MNVTAKCLHSRNPGRDAFQEYETHDVMMLQKLDKVKRIKLFLAFSLTRIGRDVHDLAWWSDRTRSKRRFADLLRLHFPLPQPVTSRCSHILPEDQVFRSEPLGSSSLYLRNPSVELLQESTRAPVSCWRDFVFAPFPRTTSSFVLRPLLTTPEVSFDDTILSLYHRFQTRWTAGRCRLSFRGAGRCARVLQTRTHQVVNSSPWQQEVFAFKTCSTNRSNNNSLLIKMSNKGGHRTICLNLQTSLSSDPLEKRMETSGLCVNRRRFRVLEMTSCSSVARSHEVRGSP